STRAGQSSAAKTANAGMPEVRRYYTCSDLEAMLRCTRQTVWNMRRDGRLPQPMVFGRSFIRFDAAQVEEAIARAARNEPVTAPTVTKPRAAARVKTKADIFV